MSQLDDDLYGDLYADDSEFAVPLELESHTQSEEVKAPVKEELSKPTAQSLVQTTATTPPPDTGSMTAPALSAVKSVSTVTSVSTTDALATQSTNVSSTPAPAPIPTYTESTSRVMPPVSNGSAYSTQIQQYSTQGYDQNSNVDYQDYNNQYQQRNEIAQVDTTAERSRINVFDRSVRPSEMKDEGKMFVGGLNWDTTDETLRNYFSEFGKVDACTIMRDASGRSRGFAFLTFEDPAAVNAVMVREHYLDGKIIDPKRAIPRQEHSRTQKIFVGGLAPSVTNESMRQFFSQFGRVIDATVMIDRDSSRSKGFGFVTFDEKADVESLIGKIGLDIEGKVVEVKLAQPRGAQIANQNYFRDGSQGGQGMGGGGGGTGGGGSFGQQVNTAPAAAAATGGQTPFDAQALAQLYQRMLQQFGGNFGASGMNPMMGGGMGMNPMMGAAGNMGMGGMGMGGFGRGMGAGGMMMGGGTGMGGGMGRGGSMNPNTPRGPRGTGPPTGPSGNVGPQRAGGGHHRFHPYGR